jgi:hypothetical protein
MRSSSAGERRVGLICGRGAFVMVSRQLNRWSVPVSWLCLGLLECTWAEAGTYNNEYVSWGLTICPMSEIVCFPVLIFTYSHVENSLFFALDLAVSL